MNRALRWSKASGSTKQLVDRLIRRGWKPGDRIRPNRKVREGGGV
jgi:hypothetical protein